MTRVQRRPTRRNVIDFSKSQLGDLSQRDIAGGNIYNGVSPEHIVALLHEVIADSRQYRELDQLERDIRRREQDEDRQRQRHAQEEKDRQLQDKLASLEKDIAHVVKDIGQYREIGVSADQKTVGGLRQDISVAKQHIGYLRIALIVAAVVVGLLLIAVAWLLYRAAATTALRPIVGALAALALAGRTPPNLVRIP
jgi:hypothetical protein